jgi:hypothetical protein
MLCCRNQKLEFASLSYAVQESRRMRSLVGVPTSTYNISLYREGAQILVPLKRAGIDLEFSKQAAGYVLHKLEIKN